MLACGLQLIQLKIFTPQHKQIISGGGEGESKYVSLSVNRAPCQLGYDIKVSAITVMNWRRNASYSALLLLLDSYFGVEYGNTQSGEEGTTAYSFVKEFK